MRRGEGGSADAVASRLFILPSSVTTLGTSIAAEDGPGDVGVTTHPPRQTGRTPLLHDHAGTRGKAIERVARPLPLMRPNITNSRLLLYPSTLFPLVTQYNKQPLCPSSSGNKTSSPGSPST